MTRRLFSVGWLVFWTIVFFPIAIIYLFIILERIHDSILSAEYDQHIRYNKKGYDWVCEYCGKEFKTQVEAQKHELVCKKK